jgi:oxygen-independent coproporphyrinogen-3 oxidase
LVCLEFLQHIPNLSVYVHVPFCTRKCEYCDFYSVAETGIATRRHRRVVDACVYQLEWFLSRIRPREVVSVYIGGGTPSVLGPAALAGLVRRVLDAAGGCPTEVTVEVNPETTSAELVDSAWRAGVTRLSMGVQSFNAGTLEAMGRACSPEDTRRGARIATERWPGALNVDLMVGVPCQRVEDSLRDVSEVLRLAPDHVSLYTLTIEEGTPLAHQIASGSVPRPDDEAVTDMWLAARDALVHAGYRQYEISNYARPGEESLHNMRYWNLDPYVGIGPAAVSTVPGHGGGVLRAHGPRSIDAFLQGRPAGWGCEWERVGPREFALEHFMMGLRLEAGLERRRFAAVFGIDPAVAIRETISRWKDRVLVSPERIVLRSRELLDSFLADAAAELRQVKLDERTNWPYSSRS